MATLGLAGWYSAPDVAAFVERHPVLVEWLLQFRSSPVCMSCLVVAPLLLRIAFAIRSRMLAARKASASATAAKSKDAKVRGGRPLCCVAPHGVTSTPRPHDGVPSDELADGSRL